MSDIAIRVENLSKQYKLGATIRHDTFRDFLSSSFNGLFRRSQSSTLSSRSSNTIWALKEVSFEVKQGEVVGIIGRNGAGKSTLLKILSRITEPTSGRASIYGRVGSLLEVGTGFDRELTGRENIYLNGAILGMTKREIGRKFDEIVDFSGVEKFIDTPIKRFSSGMNVRLAFAVAAHLETEILIVDEVLAVGDAAFQKKCLGKMEGVAKGGRTVLFVSHNMAAIDQLCMRAVWFEGGQLKIDGPPINVVSSYLTPRTVNRSEWIYSSSEPNNKKVQITSARILSIENQPTSVVHFRGQCKVEIEYEVKCTVKDLSIILQLADLVGNIVWSVWDTDKAGWKSNSVREPGRYVSVCNVSSDLLKPGYYHLSVGSCLYNSNDLSEYHEGVLSFDVSHVGYHVNPNRAGVLLPPLEWEIRRIEEVESHSHF